MNYIKTFFTLLSASVIGLFEDSGFNIQKAPINDPSPEPAHQLQSFERSFTYPFSSDEIFTIQHGKNGDYFAFFKRLGEPYFYTATPTANSKEIAAAICLVLRKIQDKDGKPLCAWYVCDLKVNKNYQGKHLPITLVKKVGFKHFLQCSRGFAITMNPATGEPRAAAIFKQHGPVSLQTQTLNLYNLTSDQAQKYKNNLESLYKKYGYMKPDEHIGTVSTSGDKDYIITNTQTNKNYPWNLIHIKPGAPSYTPQTGATHMICAVEGTGLDTEFKNLFGNPSSSAQIISSGMENVDFNFLTSDQI